MILSHRHRFIFIKTRKTAGTSIEIALSKYCGDDDIITPITPEDERIRRELGYRGPQHCWRPFRRYTLRDWERQLVRGRRKAEFFNHMRAEQVVRLVGEALWKDYFSFCVERDPWEKVISSYHFRFPEEPRPSLREYVESDGPRLSDWDRYTIGGGIAVDRVCRYERLGQELDEVARRIGLPGPLELPRAKGGFRKDRRPAAEVMSREDRAAVAEIFRREIEAFGYREPGASRQGGYREPGASRQGD